MSHRREQLASTIRKALQERLSRGLADPRVSGLITVTSVELSSDLKQADVGISVLPAERQDLVMHGLRHAAARIRREVGEEVYIKRMPDLVFQLDLSLKRQAEVLGALARVAAENERRGAAAPDPAPDEPSRASGADPADATEQQERPE